MSATSARRRMARVDRNRQLLQVAEAVFAERGIAAASMDEIAVRAGVTKPVLYSHFGSKDGLLAAVIERTGRELGERVEAAISGSDDPAGGLSRGLRAYFDFIGEHRAAWLALSGGAGGDSAAAALEKVRRDRALFIAGLIIAEVPETDVTRAMTYAHAVIGACERLATLAPQDGPYSPEQLSADLMDVIWLGFERIRTGEKWVGRRPVKDEPAVRG